MALAFDSFKFKFSDDDSTNAA